MDPLSLISKAKGFSNYMQFITIVIVVFTFLSRTSCLSVDWPWKITSENDQRLLQEERDKWHSKFFEKEKQMEIAENRFSKELSVLREKNIELEKKEEVTALALTSFQSKYDDLEIRYQDLLVRLPPDQRPRAHADDPLRDIFLRARTVIQILVASAAAVIFLFAIAIRDRVGVFRQFIYSKPLGRRAIEALNKYGIIIFIVYEVLINIPTYKLAIDKLLRWIFGYG
jgi:hypothetical protein